MKTILVPTDLSELANNALHVAADIARTYGAEILLVHYLPFSITTASTVKGSIQIASYLNEQEATAAESLQKLANNADYQDVSITPVVSRDSADLYETITNLVRRPDLIVLGTHGTSGWDELLFGSNAERIVRHAHCPVLVVKEACTSFAPKNPVAAINVDDDLKENWPVYPFNANGNSLKQFFYVRTPNDVLVPEGVQEWMQESAQKQGLTDYEFHIRQARTVEIGILNYALDCQSDLIVVYTHGHTGLRHFLQGSTAEDILNHAPIPVLILRINDGSSRPSIVNKSNSSTTSCKNALLPGVAMVLQAADSGVGE